MLSSSLQILCIAAVAHSLPVQIVSTFEQLSLFPPMPACLGAESESGPWSGLVDDGTVLMDSCSGDGFWEFIDGKLLRSGDEMMCLGRREEAFDNGLTLRLCSEENSTWEFDSKTGAISSKDPCFDCYGRQCLFPNLKTYCQGGDGSETGGPHSGLCKATPVWVVVHAHCDGSIQQRWRLNSTPDRTTDPTPMPDPTPAPDPSHPPRTTPAPSAGIQIQSLVSSLCVDLPGGDTSNGALLWTWECYGGDSQQWSFQEGQLVYLPDPSKCVDLLGRNSTNGNGLGIWDCYQGDSQMWGFDEEWGTIYLASSAASDATKCAQIGGENKGDPLVIWDCTIEPQQIWKLGSTPVPNPDPKLDPCPWWDCTIVV